VQLEARVWACAEVARKKANRIVFFMEIPVTGRRSFGQISHRRAARKNAGWWLTTNPRSVIVAVSSSSPNLEVLEP
jgi:hypothetical protein